MIDEVSIKLDDCSVGVGKLERMGLYYSIHCICNFSVDGIYKLLISGNKGSVILGTCIPKGKRYILEKKIPIKAVGEENLQITVLANTGTGKQSKVRVTESEEFPYIGKLKHSRFIRDSDGIWICFDSGIR